MSCYRIKVEGKLYEVEVEKIQGEAAKSEPARPVQPMSTPAPAAPAQKAASRPPAPKPSAAGVGDVTAPMGGKVVTIQVKKGDTVAVEDVLLTLEAMKLENEIRAQQEGTVIDILTSEGATVDAGDVLLKIG
jgi:biotin carboxyl carrier protein